MGLRRVTVERERSGNITLSVTFGPKKIGGARTTAGGPRWDFPYERMKRATRPALLGEDQDLSSEQCAVRVGAA